MAGGRLVFSTDGGELCPRCELPRMVCECASEQASHAGDSTVVVARETKGRRGKGVTVVRGVGGTHAELAALGKELKKRCGSGGTVKDGVIEIQGEHRDTLVAELTRRGYAVKRSGG